MRETFATIQARPLLGLERERAVEALDEFALRLDPNEHAELAILVALRRLETDRPPPENVLEQLSGAEEVATDAGLTALACRMCLRWCHALGRQAPEALPQERLRSAVALAQEIGGLDVEWRLALAVADSSRCIALMEEVLTLLPSPAEDHVRLSVHLDLADRCAQGADAIGAEQHLRAALSIAEQHADRYHMARCNRLLALHLLSRARRPEAIQRLSAALETAIRDEDDRSVVLCATLLTAHHLGSENMVKATETADLLLTAGARRGNWFAVADGHISRSAIDLRAGDVHAAIERLVRASVRLRALVPSGTINLFKGRLAEIRVQLGAEAFDPLFDQSVRANTPRAV